MILRAQFQNRRSVLPHFRRGLRRFVVKRLLFNKSAESADLNKCQKELDAIVRIAA